MKNPRRLVAERYQSAEEIRDALKRILAQDDLHAFDEKEMLTFSKDDWK